MAWVNDIIQGILTGGLYALYACGLSLLFGVMKVVNLAHGDLAVVGVYIGVGVLTVTHLPFGWSIPVVLAGMAVLGYVLQRSLIQAALSRGELTTLIVTFGLSIVIENGLQRFFSSDTRSIGSGSALLASSIKVNAQIHIPWLQLITFAVAVVVLLAMQWFLSASKHGRMIRAVADDREAALLSGVNARHVFGIAAALAFASVGLAGVADSFHSQGVTPTDGTNTILLYAFASVVIGGLGSLWGTLLGGIVLGVAQNIGAQINISYDQLAGYLVFLVVLAIRPQGLTARRS
jgi:branched-chain amino acid transport system permease protein